MQKIVWSEFQKNIFKEIASGSGHLIVSARAGSSKSTSLIEAIKYIPAKKKTLVVAFNTRIANELKERAPDYPNLEISTLHSFGYRMLRKALGPIKVDKDKAFKVIQKILAPLKSHPKDRDDYETIFEMKRCVSLCKNLLVDTPSKIDDLVMDGFDISTGSLTREEFIKKTIQAIGECKKQTKSTDFDDMLHMLFALHLPIDQYDMVIVDEVQDLTPAQMFVLIAACKKGGRICAFGDPFQVLYSFAGVEIDGIDKLQEKLQAKVLTLPISYRCAKHIIFKAQKLVPDITSAPSAPDGKVSYITENQIPLLVKRGDLILSRTNAQLVKICLDLWKRKIPANLRGRDLGPSLTSLIKQSKKKEIKAFLAWLEKWKKAEVARLTAKGRNIKAILDKVECLTILSDGKKTVDELLSTIKQLFEDKDKNNIVSLSSIHSAKGEEYKRVFFLEYTMVFGLDAPERNCLYVAYTRAKEELYLVQK